MKKRSLVFGLSSLELTRILLLLALLTLDTKAQNQKSTDMKTDTTKSIIQLQADSSLNAKARTQLRFIKEEAFLPSSLNSFALKRSNYEWNDYRYSGDLLIPQNALVKNLGSVGVPNEIILYGMGYGSTSILNDGIELNNRLVNSFNLYLYQSEDMDSIECMPLSRGFLLGKLNNPVSLNIISRDIVEQKAYSRLKFYQAGNEEGFLDAVFSLNPIKRLNTTIELTNQSTPSRYSNSDYSNWIGSIKAKYLLNENITLQAKYRQATSTIELNGGVDLEAIYTNYSTANPNDIIFNPSYRMVRFDDRYITIKNNQFNISAFAQLWNYGLTQLSFYYNDELTGFRQNINTVISDGEYQTMNDNKSHSFGVLLKQNLKTQFIDLNFVAQHERTIINSPLLINEYSEKNYSAYVNGTLKFLEPFLIPNGYIKYLRVGGINYLGLGADGLINVSKDFSLYAGLSRYQKPYSVLERLFIDKNKFDNSQTIQTAEVKLSYQTAKVKSSLDLFLTSNNHSLIAAFNDSITNRDEADYVGITKSELKGINFSLDLKIWKILFTTRNSYYLSKDERLRRGIPEFISNGGIYYIDTLFQNNLHLKTGINYSSVGSRFEERIDFQKSISSPFFYNSVNNSLYQINKNEFSPSFQIDFFLAGRIQEKATVYFVWENLLNSQYYIIPYYPMQPRGLRFGVAWEFLD